MENISKRYKKARIFLKLSQEKASEQSGITQTAISMLERGLRKNINEQYIDFLVEKGINKTWLLIGESEMIITKENNQKQLEINLTEKPFSEKSNALEDFDEKVLLQQKVKEQEKKIDRLNTLLMSANEKIDSLTSLLLSKFDFKDLEKLKAYTMQPLNTNSAVYAHS